MSDALLTVPAPDPKPTDLDGILPPQPEDELARWALEQITDARAVVDKWRKDAADADRFAAGQHFPKADMEQLRSEGRPTAMFNAAQKWLRFVSGLERQARLEIQFLPRNPHNDKASQEGDLVTKAKDWVLASCNGSAERSIAFEDMLRRGIGWTDTSLDRSIEPDGLIRVERVDGMEMLWDTRARKACLEDARWIARERQISKKEALLRFPEHRAAILASAASATPGAKPGESTLLSEKNAVPIETGVPWPGLKPGNVPIVEFQWYEEEPGIHFYDPLEGKEDWLAEAEFRRYRARYAKIAPRLRARARDATVPMDEQQRAQLTALPDDLDGVRVLVRMYKRMLLIGRTIVWGPHPLPDKRFTFNCITGQWDADQEVWYGFLRLLMDPQRYMTKFANQVMEIIQRSAKGGVYAELDAVDNPVEFAAQYARTGSVSWMKPGKLGAVREKGQPTLPDSSIRMFDTCMRMLVAVTGIEPEAAMGAGAADVPAVTMRQRQLAAQLLLTVEFDALRRYEVSEAWTIFGFLKLIADNRWIRIGEPYNADIIQLVKNPFCEQYDVVASESTRDPNIREQYWASIERMAPTLMRTGMWLPEFLDFAPWPPSLRFALKQRMMQQQQQQQQMAQQGLSMAGRGKPVSFREVQAREQKLRADAILAQAKATALMENTKTSKAKVALEALIKAQETDLARDAQAQSGQQAQGKMLMDAAQLMAGMGQGQPEGPAGGGGGDAGGGMGQG